MTDTQDQTAVLPTADAAGSSAPARKRSGGLSGMLLPELQSLAGSLGIAAGRLRKAELVSAIQAAQSGSATKSRATQTPDDRGAPSRPQNSGDGSRGGAPGADTGSTATNGTEPPAGQNESRSRRDQQNRGQQQDGARTNGGQPQGGTTPTAAAQNNAQNNGGQQNTAPRNEHQNRGQQANEQQNRGQQNTSRAAETSRTSSATSRTATMTTAAAAAAGATAIGVAAVGRPAARAAAAGETRPPTSQSPPSPKTTY